VVVKGLEGTKIFYFFIEIFAASIGRGEIGGFLLYHGDGTSHFSFLGDFLEQTFIIIQYT
jgi:hypothetical protein